MCVFSRFSHSEMVLKHSCGRSWNTVHTSVFTVSRALRCESASSCWPCWGGVTGSGGSAGQPEETVNLADNTSVLLLLLVMKYWYFYCSGGSEFFFFHMKRRSDIMGTKRVKTSIITTNRCVSQWNVGCVEIRLNTIKEKVWRFLVSLSLQTVAQTQQI